MKNPSMVTWIKWFGSAISASCILCVFAFTNFQTKSDAATLREADIRTADNTKQDIVQRLDRIENKIDSIRQHR